MKLSTSTRGDQEELKIDQQPSIIHIQEFKNNPVEEKQELK